MTKILFLDIDGVLNSEKYLFSEEMQQKEEEFCKNHYKNGLPVDFDLAFMLDGKNQIDPLAVAKLNKIVELTNATVILSSSWRCLFSIDEMNDILQFNGANFKIEDKTPKLYGGCRGDEILQFLSNFSGTVSKFVILDDESDMDPVMEHLVRTDFKVGLTDQEVDICVNLLNG